MGWWFTHTRHVIAIIKRRVTIISIARYFKRALVKTLFCRCRFRFPTHMTDVFSFFRGGGRTTFTEKCNAPARSETSHQRERQRRHRDPIIIIINFFNLCIVEARPAETL